MNREIKFRAWIKEEKIMTDVKNLYYDNNGLNKVTGRQKLLMITRRPFEDSLIGDFELMQYTDLKDKNGVEIYEGDIVASASPELIFQVVYKAPSFCRKWIDDTSKRHHDPVEPMAWNTHIICEVIGNIYEHPHLIEGVD